MTWMQSLTRTCSRRAQRIVRRTSRYDLVLAIIPLSFLLAGVLGWMAAIPLTMAAGLASTLSLLAVLDALFINPPRGPTVDPPTA